MIQGSCMLTAVPATERAKGNQPHVEQGAIRPIDATRFRRLSLGIEVPHEQDAVLGMSRAQEEAEKVVNGVPARARDR